MVYRVAGFEQRHTARVLVHIIDTGLFTETQLARVRDHLVKANLAANTLEIRIIRIGQRVGKVDAITAAITHRLYRGNDFFTKPGNARNQFDRRAGLKAFSESPL